MLKIHTSDGKTHRFDMRDGEQAKVIIERMKSRDFQATITGVSIVAGASSRIKCPSCERAGELVCQGCGFAIPNDARSRTGVQYSLSKPDGYAGNVFYSAEDVPNAPGAHARGGERVTCFAGDSRLQMMVHHGQPSARVTLVRTGRPAYLVVG